MNGFDLAGRPIRVGLGNDKFTPESTANLLQRFQGNPPSNYQGSAFSGSGGRGSHAGGAGGNFDRAGGGRDNEKGSGGGASALDDTDVAGVNFNNYSRDALMRKLARTDDAPAEADTKRHAVPAKKESRPLPVNVSQASRCVLLRNMFDPTE
jgi:RNA-binding protein 39